MELFLKLCISQGYKHNLEKNLKNSACIGINMELQYEQE